MGSVILRRDPGTSTLLTSDIAFWALGEADGASRADSVGSNTLTDNNTVTQATGRVGNAAQFNGTNQYLSIADNADLSMGDIDFSLSCWVYMDTKSSGVSGIMGKWNAAQEYLINYTGTSGTDRFQFIIENASATQTSVEADSLGSPRAATWYLIVAWYDASSDELSIQINNGPIDVSSTHTGGAQDNTDAFEIGRSSGANYLDGIVDAAGVWKKVLNQKERTILWNCGAGIENPFTISTEITINPAIRQPADQETFLQQFQTTPSGKHYVVSLSYNIPTDFVLDIIGITVEDTNGFSGVNSIRQFIESNLLGSENLFQYVDAEGHANIVRYVRGFESFRQSPQLSCQYYEGQLVFRRELGA
jgi:hypothetical protein